MRDIPIPFQFCYITRHYILYITYNGEDDYEGYAYPLPVLLYYAALYPVYYL